MSRDFKVRPTVNGANVLLAGDTVTADTELEAAAALGDAGSNPTTPRVGSAGLIWNGTGWDRIRSIDGLKTASSTPDVGIPAFNLADRRFTSVNLGTVVGNTQAWDCMGADAAMIFVGTSTTGTFIFEVTADGSTWQSAEVRLTGQDTWQTGVNQTPTSGNAYRILTAGYRSVRARTVTTLGATVALTTTLAADTVMLMALKTAAAPHNFGYALTSKTAQYTTTQSTAADLWTPASGKKLVITSYQIQAGGTTAGTVQLWFGASGDTSYTRATDLALFDGEFAPSSTLKPGVVQSGCWIASAVDHRLKVQDSAAINPLTVTVWGYEV